MGLLQSGRRKIAFFSVPSHVVLEVIEKKEFSSREARPARIRESELGKFVVTMISHAVLVVTVKKISSWEGVSHKDSQKVILL